MCCNVTYPFEVHNILSWVFFWSLFYHFIFTKKFHASLAKRKSFLEQFSFSCLLSCTNSFLYLCLRSCHRVLYKIAWYILYDIILSYPMLDIIQNCYTANSNRLRKISNYDLWYYLHTFLSPLYLISIWLWLWSTLL